MAGIFKSRVSRAMKGTGSVRTTIPEAVAALLGVEHGSTLVWAVESGTGRVWVSSGTDEARKSSRRR